MPDEINYERRQFFSAAAMTLAAAQLGISATAHAPSPSPGLTPAVPEALATPTSFGPLKQINAGLLNVSYADVGPADGKPVLLLHGWPYDIYSFAEVAPILAAQGYRCIIPFLRGYGPTRFVSADTFRNGQPAALAQDAIDLLDALKLDKPIIAGFDWGARTADIVAALWPNRCKALVSVSGYLIGNQQSGKSPLPPAAA